MIEHYECIIIGGGIAGLQAAVQLGRYKHNILVIDSNDGRSNLCKGYHNILGWPDGVSGETLRSLGKIHAQRYRVQFQTDKVVQVRQEQGLYIVTTEAGTTYKANIILLATGVMDRLPNILHIKDGLGLTVYVCPDCDGYEVQHKRVLVLGAGKTGAEMSLALTYWTKDIVYINHDGTPIEDELQKKLHAAEISYINEKIEEVLTEDGSFFQGVRLQSGKIVSGERAFIAFGGNHVRNELAEQLGVSLQPNKHIITDPRTKETNIRNVWVAGDIAIHSEQVTIAMGEGAQAAIWIHKRLLEEQENRRSN
ncbi:NAD(P)/FAD-dependent oxidoreductase [Bacillus sp. OTU530]|uniref:NAD(P)/FAD-dependent oxidoreductase n=1 Tax=Bacillus sp. OTU530 TaxID=3043862 RepID=UPI00313DB5FF